MPAAQMTTAKVGNKNKSRQSRSHKSYYANYRARYEITKVRRKRDRDRRVSLAQDFPEVGSPSQLRQRRKDGRLPKKGNK